MKTFLQNFYFNIVHIQKKPGNQDSSAHTSYSLCKPVPCLHLEDANYFSFYIPVSKIFFKSTRKLSVIVVLGYIVK